MFWCQNEIYWIIFNFAYSIQFYSAIKSLLNSIVVLWDCQYSEVINTWTTSVVKSFSWTSGMYLEGFVSSCSKNTPSSVIFPNTYYKYSSMKFKCFIEINIIGLISPALWITTTPFISPVCQLNKTHLFRPDTKHHDEAIESPWHRDRNIYHQTVRQSPTSVSAGEFSAPFPSHGILYHVHFLIKTFSFQHMHLEK